MPVSLGFVPAGELFIEPQTSSEVRPSPVDPYFYKPRNTGIVPPIHQRGGAGGLVTQPTDQSSADALVRLVNKAGHDANMTLATGLVESYLEGVSIGSILFNQALAEKEFDDTMDTMSCEVASRKSFTVVPILPAYPKKVVAISFSSETMDAYQATEKFRSMYGSQLNGIVASGSDAEGDDQIVFIVDNAESENALYNLTHEASMNPAFGAEAVVRQPANFQDTFEKNQIEEQRIQAMQFADSFVSQNTGRTSFGRAVDGKPMYKENPYAGPDITYHEMKCGGYLSQNGRVFTRPNNQGEYIANYTKYANGIEDCSYIYKR